MVNLSNVKLLTCDDVLKQFKVEIKNIHTILFMRIHLPIMQTNLCCLQLAAGSLLIRPFYKGRNYYNKWPDAIRRIVEKPLLQDAIEWRHRGEDGGA